MFRIAPGVDFDVFHEFFGLYAVVSLEIDVFDRGFFLDVEGDDLSLGAVRRLDANIIEIPHVVDRLQISGKYLGNVFISGPGGDDSLDGLIFDPGIAFHLNVRDEFPGNQGFPYVVRQFLNSAEQVFDAFSGGGKFPGRSDEGRFHQGGRQGEPVPFPYQFPPECVGACIADGCVSQALLT